MEKVLVREYFASGSIKSEHYEINGAKDGLEQWWHENGQIFTECEYVSGVPHGRVQVWSESGHFRALEFVKNGASHGEYTSWWDNGNIKEHGIFIEGVRQSGFKWYHKDGSLWSEL